MNPRMRDSSGIMKIGTNVTPFKRTPLAERKKTKLSQRLTGDVAIYETDEVGFIVSWSAVAEQLYGYEADEIMGKHIASLYPATDLLHGKPIFYSDFGWQCRKNGQDFWAYAECQTIKDKNDKLLGYRKFVVETPAVSTVQT